MGTGVADGVSFRNPGCGFEGKWKDGLMGVNCVPEFSRFPHAGEKGRWILAWREWKAWFGAGLMRLWRVRVLQRRCRVHSLHRGALGSGKSASGQRTANSKQRTVVSGSRCWEMFCDAFEGCQ